MSHFILKRLMLSLFVCITLTLSIIAPAHCNEPDLHQFAKTIVEESDRANWKNLQQVVSWYCPSIKKSMSKPRILNGWKLGYKYGDVSRILKVTAEEGFSGTKRTDVKVVSTNSKYRVLYRFWIKVEQNQMCLYGYNFAELIAEGELP